MNVDLTSQPLVLMMLCLVALCALALLTPQLPAILKSVERIANNAFNAAGKLGHFELRFGRAPPETKTMDKQKTRLEDGLEDKGE